MKVNILGRDYDIMKVEELIENNECCMGLCNFETGVILIKNDLSKYWEKYTTNHEKLHALLFEMGYNELAECEPFVSLLARHVEVKL